MKNLISLLASAVLVACLTFSVFSFISFENSVVEACGTCECEPELEQAQSYQCPELSFNLYGVNCTVGTTSCNPVACLEI